jgi:hypothetical protein
MTIPRVDFARSQWPSGAGRQGYWRGHFVATVADLFRVETPDKIVSYVGLNPSVLQSVSVLVAVGEDGDAVDQSPLVVVGNRIVLDDAVVPKDGVAFVPA